MPPTSASYTGEGRGADMALEIISALACEAVASQEPLKEGRRAGSRPMGQPWRVWKNLYQEERGAQPGSRSCHASVCGKWLSNMVRMYSA
jgi:hypothetical protein